MFRDFQSLKAGEAREPGIREKQIVTLVLDCRLVFAGVGNGANLSLEVHFGEDPPQQQHIAWIIFEIQNPQRRLLH